MDILASLKASLLENTYTGSIWNFAFFFSDRIGPFSPLSHMEEVVINSTCTKVSKNKHY